MVAAAGGAFFSMVARRKKLHPGDTRDLSPKRAGVAATPIPALSMMANVRGAGPDDVRHSAASPPALPRAGAEVQQDRKPEASVAGPLPVVMQDSLFRGRQVTQNAGASAADRTVPQAASLASMSRGASSCGTETSRGSVRCGRGASICWNQDGRPMAERVDKAIDARG